MSKELVPVIYALRSQVDPSSSQEAQAEAISDSMGKLERLYGDYDSLEIVHDMKRMLSDQFLNQGDSIAIRDYVHSKGTDSVRKSLVHKVGEELTPADLLVTSFPQPNKKQKSGFYSFNFDDIPNFEPLEVMLQALRLDPTDELATSKVTRMDLAELQDHPQWDELLQILFSALTSFQAHAEGPWLAAMSLLMRFAGGFQGVQGVQAGNTVLRYLLVEWVLGHREEERISLRGPSASSGPSGPGGSRGRDGERGRDERAQERGKFEISAFVYLLRVSAASPQVPAQKESDLALVYFFLLLAKGRVAVGAGGVDVGVHGDEACDGDMDGDGGKRRGGSGSGGGSGGACVFEPVLNALSRSSEDGQAVAALIGAVHPLSALSYAVQTGLLRRLLEVVPSAPTLTTDALETRPPDTTHTPNTLHSPNTTHTHAPFITLCLRLLLTLFSRHSAALTDRISQLAQEYEWQGNLGIFNAPPSYGRGAESLEPCEGFNKRFLHMTGGRSVFAWYQQHCSSVSSASASTRASSGSAGAASGQFLSKWLERSTAEVVALLCREASGTGSVSGTSLLGRMGVASLLSSILALSARLPPSHCVELLRCCQSLVKQCSRIWRRPNVELGGDADTRAVGVSAGAVGAGSEWADPWAQVQARALVLSMTSGLRACLLSWVEGVERIVGTEWGKGVEGAERGNWRKLPDELLRQALYCVQFLGTSQLTLAYAGAGAGVNASDDGADLGAQMLLLVDACARVGVGAHGGEWDSILRAAVGFSFGVLETPASASTSVSAPESALLRTSAALQLLTTLSSDDRLLDALGATPPPTPTCTTIPSATSTPAPTLDLESRLAQVLLSVLVRDWDSDSGGVASLAQVRGLLCLCARWAPTGAGAGCAMTGCSMTGCSMTGGAGGVAGGFAGLLGTGGAMRGLVRALALGATSASVFGDAYEDLQGPFPCLQLLLGLLSLGLYVEVGAVLHQAWGNVVTIGTGEMEDIEGTEETEETDEMEMGGMKDEPIHQHQGRPTDQGPTPTPDLRDLPTLCAAIASHDPRVAYLHSEGFFPYLLRMLTAAQGDLQFCAEVAHSSLVSPHLAHAHPHVCRTLNGALMTVSPLSIAGTGGKGDVGGAEDVGGAGGESEEGVSLDSLFRAMTLEMLLCLASGTPLRPVRSLLYPETGACAGAGVGAGCVTYPTSSSASARTSTSTSALSALIPWQQPLQVGELRTLVLHRLQPSPSSSPSPLPAESVNFSSPGTAAGVVVAGLTGVDISARVRVVQSVLQGGTTFAQLLTGALTREGGGGGSGGSEGRDGKDVYQSGFDCAWFWAACLLHSAPLSHISTPIPDFSAMEACATHILHSHRGGFAVHVLASVGAPLSLLLRPLFCYWFHTVGVGAVGAVGAGDIPLALAAMALYTGGRGPALAAAALVLRCADACVAEVVTLEGLLRQMRISSQLDLGSLLDEMQAIAFLEGEILALLLLRP